MKIRIVTILAWLVVATALCAGLVAAALLGYANTPDAARRIARFVSQGLPVDVQWRTQRIVPWRGIVEVRGLRMLSREGRQLVCAERVHVNIALWRLWARTIELSQISLDRPDVLARVDSTGAVDLVHLFSAMQDEPADQPKPPVHWRLIVRSLDIRDLHASLTTPAALWEVRVDRIRSRLDWTPAAESVTSRLQIDRCHLQGPAGNDTLEQAGVDFLIVGPDLTLRSLDVSGPAVQAGVSGTIVNLDGTPLFDLSVKLRGELDLAARHGGCSGCVTGRIALQGVVRGSLDDPEITLQLDCSDAVAGGYPVRRVQAAARLAGHTVTIDSVRVDGDAGQLVRLQGQIDGREVLPDKRLAGRVDVDRLSWRLHLYSRNLDIAPLTAQVCSGSVDGTLSCTGQGITAAGMRMQVDGRLRARDFNLCSVGAALECSLQVRASLTSQAVHVDSLIWHSQPLVARLTGAYSWGTGSVDAHLSIAEADLSRIMNVWYLDGWHGRVRGEATAKGLLPRADYTLSLQADTVGYRDWRADRLAVSAAMPSDGPITIRQCDAAAGASRCVVRGWADLFVPGGYDLLAQPSYAVQIDSTMVHLDDWLPDGGGMVTVEGDAFYRTDSIGGVLRLGARDLRWHNHVVVSAQAALHARGETLWCDSLDALVGPGTPVRFRGELDLDQSCRFALEVPAVPLAALPLPDSLPVTLQGMFSASLSGGGTLRQPDAQLAAQVASFKMDGQALDDVSLRAMLRSDTATFTMDSPLAFNGWYGVRTGHYGASLLFDHTSLLPWSALAGQPDLSGMLNGTISIRGRALHPDSLDGEISLGRSELHYGEWSLLQIDSLAATMAQGVVRLPAGTCRILNDGILTATVWAHPSQGVYDVQSKAELPLQLMDIFVPQISDAAGSARLQLHLRVDKDSTDYRLDGEISRLAFTIAENEQRVHDVSASLSAQGNEIILESARGRIDDGRFDLRGALRMNGLQPGPLRLQINTAALPLRVPGMVDMRVSGGVTLGGVPDSTHLRGDIAITNGYYFQDWKLQLDELGRANIVADSAPPFTQPYLRNLSCDVRMTSRDDFIIDNTLSAVVNADLSVRPAVTLAGTLNTPVITGQATVSEGTLQYLRRTFKVKRGTIDFVNPFQTEPSFQLEGETDISRWRINLTVSGTPVDLVFKLSSTSLNGSAPILEDQDIISLLLVGRTTAELRGDDPSTASQSAEDLVSQIVGTLFQEELKNRTGLDVLNVESSPGSRSAGPDRIKVTIGKNLTPRLATAYSVESENGTVVQEASVQYRLTESMSIRGYNATSGTYGGEIRMTLEFP